MRLIKITRKNEFIDFVISMVFILMETREKIIYSFIQRTKFDFLGLILRRRNSQLN